MNSEIKVYVDGEWILLPQTHYEAKRQGWYHAFDYNAFNVFDTFPYTPFKEWCAATFPVGTYVVFTGNAWFLREQDAVFAKLRWL